MNVIEYPIDLETAKDSRAVGTVIISDAHLLIRPAVPGQYPSNVKHDSAHAYRVLDLGNDMSMYYQWHIICQEDPAAAHELLDRVFYAYVEASCKERWCDARVCYIVDGETVQVKEYGFEDGRYYTMVFNVYCGIPAGETEKLVATLSAKQTDNYVVIRPDSAKLGFSVQGFAVEQPVDDDTDYDEDAPEDEDPLAGDVEPTGGYYEAPVPAFDAHRLSVMRQYGDYTG